MLFRSVHRSSICPGQRQILPRRDPLRGSSLIAAIHCSFIPSSGVPAALPSRMVRRLAEICGVIAARPIQHSFISERLLALPWLISFLILPPCRSIELRTLISAEVWPIRVYCSDLIRAIPIIRLSPLVPELLAIIVPHWSGPVVHREIGRASCRERVSSPV